MKVLQVLPALRQGGVERGTLEIARALVAADVPNAVCSAGGPMVAALAALGVPHLTLPVDRKNPFTLHRCARRLAAYCRAEGVTLMHVRSRAPAWAVKGAAKASGVPWLATFHGVYGTDPRWLKIPYNRVMLMGEKVIAVSEYVRRHILATYAVDPGKVVCIPRGADTAVFSPDRVTAAAAQEEKTAVCGFPADLPVITLPGRLTRWKGQEVFLEALGRMRHRHVGALILGSDQGRTAYAAGLREQAARLPAGVQVVFRERSDDMARVYAMSDIVVNASSAQPEAFGRTIPEAQAMGRLVLATAHGGACETIADGRTGFLVPPGDAAAMARKLDEMLDMSAAAKTAMGAAAVDGVRANFSTARMCERTLALYRSLHGEDAR